MVAASQTKRWYRSKINPAEVTLPEGLTAMTRPETEAKPWVIVALLSGVKEALGQSLWALDFMDTGGGATGC